MSDWAPVQFRNSPHPQKFRVPRRIHEKAAAKYSALGYDQTAARLAERGGFSLEELIYLLADEDPFRTQDGPMQTDFFGRFPEEK